MQSLSAVPKKDYNYYICTFVDLSESIPCTSLLTAHDGAPEGGCESDGILFVLTFFATIPVRCCCPFPVVDRGLS